MQGADDIDGYIRLAVVGDTVIKLVLLDYWYSSGNERGNILIKSPQTSIAYLAK